MTLRFSQFLQGFARFSIAQRLVIIQGKSVVNMSNFESCWTGSKWHEGLTWSIQVPNGLFAFNLPSDVIKKFLASI